MEHRPIPGDPGAEAILSYFDANAEPWLLSHTGDFSSFACETFADDGSGYQRVVAIDIPVRENHSREAKRLRVMLHPALAAELAADITNALLYV